MPQLHLRRENQNCCTAAGWSCLQFVARCLPGSAPPGRSHLGHSVQGAVSGLVAPLPTHWTTGLCHFEHVEQGWPKPNYWDPNYLGDETNRPIELNTNPIPRPTFSQILRANGGRAGPLDLTSAHLGEERESTFSRTGIYILFTVHLEK